MSSNLYLFDPKKVQSRTGEKPLIDVMREAEIARAEESARIVRNGFARLSRLFRREQPVAAAKTAEASAEEHRLAA